MAHFITTTKTFLSAMTQLSTLCFVILFPLLTQAQTVEGFSPKPYEFLGGAAAAVIIVYFILQIVKLLRPPKNGTADLAGTLMKFNAALDKDKSDLSIALVKFNSALDNILAAQTRMLQKDDAILGRLEAAKISMSGVPEVHRRLLEMGDSALDKLSASALVDKDITNNQGIIKEQLGRIENQTKKE